MSDDDEYYSVGGENNSDSNSDSDSDSDIGNSNIVPNKSFTKSSYNYEDDGDDDDPQFGGEDDTDDIEEIKKVINEDEDEDEDEDEVEDDDDDEDIDIYEEETNLGKSNTKKITKPKKTQLIIEDEDEYEDDDYEDESYLQKFENHYIKNYITEFHPECLNNNYDEISQLSIVVRNSDGIIIDPLHKTLPYLTKYEKARIIGQRAKQIETGTKPLVKVPENIIDGYIIAELELKEKKIPFIIRRPIPNGSCEYWHLKDLEFINF